MDWAKVKTILIVALLFTNAIIVLFIFYDGNAENKISPQRQQQLIDRVLAAKDIDNQIDGTLLENVEMPKMMAGYQAYNMESLALRMMGDYKLMDDIYVNDDYLIAFKDKTLYITKRHYGSGNRAISVDRAREFAFDFIENILEYEADYKVKSIVESEYGIRIEYVQMYDDYFIDDTHMVVAVNADGVYQFERKWMKLHAPDKNVHRIKLYSQALFSAIDQLAERAPTSIKAVDLGYRLEKKVFGYDVKSGDTLPYYRLTLADDEQLFVPALLEGPLQ